MFGSYSSSIIGNDILDIGSRKFDHRGVGGDGGDGGGGGNTMIPYAPPSLLHDSIHDNDRFEVPNVADVSYVSFFSIDYFLVSGR